ncbi:MAG: hypothetical protein RSD35_10515, partial [Oscillospiraceae bacterium]
ISNDTGFLSCAIACSVFSLLFCFILMATRLKPHGISLFSHERLDFFRCGNNADICGSLTTGGSGTRAKRKIFIISKDKTNPFIPFGLYPQKWTVKKSTSCCRIETTAGGVVMSRQYVKMESLSEAVFRRKAADKVQ